MPSRLRRHNEYGHIHFLTFSCFRRLRFFNHENVRDAFIEAMHLVRDSLAVRWFGYTIMPEHVHLLVLPQQSGSDQFVSISTVLNQVKGLKRQTVQGGVA